VARRGETTIAGVNLAVLSGTLGQWKEAVAAGTSENTPPTVRTCYTKILLLFDRAGLTSVWSNFERRPAPDRSGHGIALGSIDRPDQGKADSLWYPGHCSLVFRHRSTR
jgi:hypothetical protein